MYGCLKKYDVADHWHGVNANSRHWALHTKGHDMKKWVICAI